MIDVQVIRNSDSTTISLHQGQGTYDETLIMEQAMPNGMADALIGDLLDGAVTVHGEGGN